MKIGATISRLRKMKNLTQEQFAEQIDLSPTSLSQIESGKKRPNSSTLNRICGALGISELHLYFLSLDETDIPENKRDLYHKIKDPLKSLVESLI
ncbi:MAG: helix-turn-helix transcriptional regulator [Bacteroidota bacterium]